MYGLIKNGHSSKTLLLISYILYFSIRYDEFLRWNPDDFNGIRRLNLPSKLIWLPDIVLYNVRYNKIDFFFINNHTHYFRMPMNFRIVM
jgi:hypothetical protein